MPKDKKDSQLVKLFWEEFNRKMRTYPWYTNPVRHRSIPRRYFKPEFL